MKVFIEFAQDKGLYPKENWFVSRTNIKGGLDEVWGDSLDNALSHAASEVWFMRTKGTFAIEEDQE